MNKSYLALIAIAGLIAFGAACDKENDANTNSAAVVNSGYDINEALDLNIDLDDNENVNAEDEDEDVNENENRNVNRNTNDDDEDDDANENRNSNTNDDDDEDSSGTVTITGPEEDEELVSPFYVEGKATGTEVFARLVAGGTTIFEDVRISVRNGEYKGKLTFDFSRTTSGRIEIYQKDGSTETNLTSVDVRFKLSSDDENENSNESENENENDNTNDEL